MFLGSVLVEKLKGTVCSSPGCTSRAEKSILSRATLAGVPVYLVGDDVPANSGDFMVKLVNGANIRKETAPVADEVVAQMKGISKV